MKRKEEFPIDNELVNQFVRNNSNNWKKVIHEKGSIIVNLSMVRMQIGWILPKLYYAKGIESITKKTVYVFSWRENESLTRLIESFGFHHIAIDELNKKNILGMLSSLFKTLGYVIVDGSGEGLKKLSIGKQRIGKNIYEDILRTSDLSTIKSGRNKVCIKKMWHLLWTYYSMNHFCKKNIPVCAVCDDIAYHEGMLIKLFHKYGAKIFNTSSTGDEVIQINQQGEIVTRSFQTRTEIESELPNVGQEGIAWCEKYLEERYQGKNGRSIDRGAFSNKKVLSRSEAQDLLKFDRNKKNIVVMAHTFTDAVFNYGETFYRDYYDWTEQTLRLAGKNSSVNWILKPHPTRSSYNESKDSIEMMYEKYKQDNIFLLSDDVSAESIKNFADVLITIGGNAGAEFACEGIPSVIIGTPYYYGFGYTIEPKTREAYESCLLEIDKFNHLNSSQIELAKKVFYLRNKPKESVYSDEFGKMIREHYKQMVNEIALQYFASNKGTRNYNSDLLRDVTKYIQTHDMHQCEYYLQGMRRIETALNSKG